MYVADCGVPRLDNDVMLNYSSTLDCSVLILTCKDGTFRSTDKQILQMTCYSNENWIPNPSQFTYSSLTEITTALHYQVLNNNRSTLQVVTTYHTITLYRTTLYN